MSRQRQPINHGTTGGYRAHFRHQVPLCDPCRAAERQRQGYTAPQKQAVCGTVSGYGRHLQLGEKTCAECRAANAQDRRTRRARVLSDGDPRHGTVNGYGNYGCRCELCLKAGAVENRRRREARAAR